MVEVVVVVVVVVAAVGVEVGVEVVVEVDVGVVEVDVDVAVVPLLSCVDCLCGVKPDSKRGTYILYTNEPVESLYVSANTINLIKQIPGMFAGETKGVKPILATSLAGVLASATGGAAK